MTAFKYSKTQYVQGGERTVEISGTALNDLSVSFAMLDFVGEADRLISAIEAAEDKVQGRKATEAREILLKDPQLRLEMLRSEKLKLEEGTRVISGLILAEEQTLAEGTMDRNMSKLAEKGG